MNALTLLRSVEELLYEVVSWLVFYPKTLWMTLSRPLRTLAYSDREQHDKPDQQYLDTLSPPLFLVLSILLAHGIELAAGLHLDQSRTALGRMITSNDQTLLSVRALAFSLYTVAYAVLFLLLSKKRIDRETVRAPFFAQCFLSGALAILTSVGTTGIRYPSDVATLAGLALILATVVWFLWVQTRWLARIEGVGRAAAFGWSVAAFAASTGAVIGIGRSSVDLPSPKGRGLERTAAKPSFWRERARGYGQ